MSKNPVRFAVVAPEEVPVDEIPVLRASLEVSCCQRHIRPRGGADRVSVNVDTNGHGGVGEVRNRNGRSTLPLTVRPGGNSLCQALPTRAADTGGVGSGDIAHHEGDRVGEISAEARAVVTAGDRPIDDSDGGVAMLPPGAECLRVREGGQRKAGQCVGEVDTAACVDCIKALTGCEGGGRKVDVDGGVEKVVKCEDFA